MINMDMLSVKYADIVKEKYQYAVLPWGATEPHNYHLPYLTDCYLAYHISMDAVIKANKKYDVNGMVLPPIALGSQNPGQRELPFCLHARYETQKAILTDIVSSLQYQGVNSLLIVNGHGGNNFKNMIRDLAVDFPDFIIACSNWYEVVSQSDIFENRDSHAGEMETSVLMHYRPDLVDLSLAGDGEETPFLSTMLREGVAWTPRNWSKVSKDTGVGNPHKSTVEKGRRCADAVTDKLSQLFMEIVSNRIYR